MAEPLVTFTRREWDNLKEAERKLADAVGLMDRAESCGVDCDAFRALADHLSRQLTAIESNFMQPPPAA